MITITITFTSTMTIMADTITGVVRALSKNFRASLGRYINVSPLEYIQVVLLWMDTDASSGDQLLLYLGLLGFLKHDRVVVAKP